MTRQRIPAFFAVASHIKREKNRIVEIDETRNGMVGLTGEKGKPS